MLRSMNPLKALYFALAGLLALTPALPFAGESPAAAGEEKELIQVLQSDAPLFEKAKACQRLAVIGTEEAVPALAALLPDAKLSHYARFGLEPIPHRSVDRAFLQAMKKLEGSLLVGVIHSIGARRKAGSLTALAERLNDQDPDVAAAAAAAIGRIGTVKAAQTLRESLASVPAERRPAVARACVRCAESLLGTGQRDEAMTLYRAARDAEVPRHIQLVATRGEIRARKDAAVPLLVENLRAPDPNTFDMALTVAREIPGSKVTRALVGELGELTPPRRARVIQALGDRGDPAALTAVIAAARTGSGAVRVAAIGALGRLGDASAVPVLLEAAARSEGETVQVARASLENLRGKKVDDAIVALLDEGESDLRPVLIELAGKRRITPAVPALEKAATDRDGKIRLAAIEALGQTLEPDKLPILTARLRDGASAEETAAVQEALRAACRRSPDRDTSTDQLLAAMEGASVDSRCLLLDVFSSLGGTRALRVVSASATDRDEKIRDTATRVLGEWKSEDGGRELLKLARTYEYGEDRLRAYRGFSNLVRRLGFPKERRLAFCREAMDLARADRERDLVLEALAGVPAAETLDLLSTYLADPALAEGASQAAITISERIVRSQQDAVAKSMTRVLKATKNEDRIRRARQLLRRAGGRR